MHKDLRSYEKHNSQYVTETNNYENTLKIIAKYDEVHQFERLGFKQAILLCSQLPKIHIDIGSGTGWLLKKTSPLFEKVIAVEPSTAATEVSQRINKDSSNIEYITEDMIDALAHLNLKDPVFITTSTVLNHIENYYVKDFLKTLQGLPDGSILFFDERYGKNIDWRLWHIRSEDWWRSCLPDWQLIFFNLDIDGYASGIYGIKLGKDTTLPTKRMSSFQKLLWNTSFFYNLSQRSFAKIWKLLRK